jgi:hypothetical protein
MPIFAIEPLICQAFKILSMPFTRKTSSEQLPSLKRSRMKPSFPCQTNHDIRIRGVPILPLSALGNSITEACAVRSVRFDDVNN